MSLTNLSIARRLALVLSLILALAAISSVLAIGKLWQVTNEVDSMIREELQTERAASDWERVATAGAWRTMAIAKSNDASLVAYFAGPSASGVKEGDALRKTVESKIRSTDDRERLDRIVKARAAFSADRDEISRLKKAGDAEAAGKLLTERFEPHTRDYMASVQALKDAHREQLNDAAGRTRTLRDQTTQMLVACCLAMLAIGGTLAWFLSRSITRPLLHAEAMATSIARMDLTDATQTHYANDETGRLLRSIDAMRSALTHSLLQVRSVVDSISTASTEIASGNQDLSIRTEQTAANLQETASSMVELTSTVRSSADAASQASQLATSAVEVAARGGQAMSRVIETMGEINGSSKRIADIIGVIDGIAFQTNILALNAAVEAARAGEQGRGFAVVASEVRSLAQRSAEAAKEIKGLIGVSVGKVAAGTRLVQDAGATMAEIVDSVKRVTDIIVEISAAATQQSQGIGQVNTAVNQLDQMTQQNAALVEESAAAAESLKDQSHRLRDVVGTFRLTALV